MQIITLVTLVLSLLLITNSNAQNEISSFDEAVQPQLPDYSKLEHWASHPNKKDNADKIPRPLRKELTNLPEQVDVFFLHPTIFTAEPKNEYIWNAAVEDQKLNKQVDKTTIKLQASIFNQAGKIYAPRYRQAHLRSFFHPNLEEGEKALELAYNDIKTAFKYYLEHYNNGRPFILAGHSQGARHLKTLLKEMFDGTELYQQLIAAYIVGWGVEADSFDEIPLGTSPDQTGCFVTWRTYAKGYRPDWIQENDVCVNPLTWKADSTYAPYEANAGAILFGFNTLRKHLFDAQVQGPILWVGKPNMFLGGLLKRDNYHVGDYNLFYLSVRNNAILRAKAFLGQQ
ncbi:DUF3089 domain-containing protein [Aureispira anguillae]|uniref:DUF3089 domain-containing protein n=1 Tax=Aureispira anguillae TaxID=2864201 RepID=A0A915YCN6_9BACT|nr:DUF3089 domain-containing protein [Aureispira anguillae]BDS10638.1 DUF3089 domain-containing protein [Aureispira anguillae]